MRLILSNQETALATADDLERACNVVHQQEFSEVRLETDGDGPLLNLLVHGNRAWLMWLPYFEYLGFSSRNPAYNGPADAQIAFVLANGQRYDFPVAWAVSLDDACAACEYFVETGGKVSPRITLHDDRVNDEK